MVISLTTDRYPFNILLLSDTHFHYGDKFPAYLTGFFRDLLPDLILHCGDLYDRDLLPGLSRLAPMYAVRGNRDILSWFRLPPCIDLTVSELRVHMEHGQGNFAQYLLKKLRILCHRFLNKPWEHEKVTRVPRNFRDYDVCIAGHTHHLQIFRSESTLIVNPGHLNLYHGRETEAPSFLLMSVTEDGIVFRKFILHDRKITEEKPERFGLRFGTGNAA